jgi:hypothetical protein
MRIVSRADRQFPGDIPAIAPPRASGRPQFRGRQRFARGGVFALGAMWYR